MNTILKITSVHHTWVSMVQRLSTQKLIKGNTHSKLIGLKLHPPQTIASRNKKKDDKRQTSNVDHGFFVKCINSFLHQMEADSGSTRRFFNSQRRRRKTEVLFGTEAKDSGTLHRDGGEETLMWTSGRWRVGGILGNAPQIRRRYLHWDRNSSKNVH